MKKLLFILFISFLLLIPNLTFAAEERIHNFEVQIQINKDSSLNVTETILYDFETLQRHGIYRDIPFKYSARGGNYNLRLTNISVFNDQGNLRPFEVSTSGKNKRIKIGDPDKLVTGRHTYIIHYTINRALNFFDDHDEFYWNSTGHDWDVPIDSAITLVSLPQNTNNSDIQLECFYGPVGSTNKCGTSLSSNKYIYTADNLAPGSGMTIVLGWPKGIVNPPSFLTNLKYIIQDNGILLLPVLVFIFLFILWHKKGRDPSGRGTIVPEYEPPNNMTPAECGTLIDERVDRRDISAEIIHLAVNGYLKITRLPGKGLLKKDDYQLDKLKSSDNSLNSFQKYLLESLFTASINSIKLSSLKNKFYSDLELLTKKIYAHLVTEGHFPKSPKKIISLYTGIGGAIIFATIAILGGLFGTLGTIALIISGILIIVFGFFMPVKTQKGVLAKEHILGLKMYLSVAEKDRIKFHNAPNKNPQHFEKLLPYAMVLKVENQWAKQFKDIYSGSPSWYADPSMTTFNAFYLATALNNFGASANTTLASRPGGGAAGGRSGFGGGGFSGGGFGGGGGGSW